MIAPLALALLLAAPGPAPRPPASARPVTVDVTVSGYVPVAELVQRLSGIFPAGSTASTVRFAALPGGRALRLTGPADQVERLRRLVTRPPCGPDRPGPPLLVIPIKHQPAAVLRRQLAGPLPAGTRILVDHPTNSLIIVGPRDVAAALRTLVQRWDRPRAAPSETRRRQHPESLGKRKCLR
jgi:hypothetical protein